MQSISVVPSSTPVLKPTLNLAKLKSELLVLELAIRKVHDRPHPNLLGADIGRQLAVDIRCNHWAAQTTDNEGKTSCYKSPEDSSTDSNERPPIQCWQEERNSNKDNAANLIPGADDLDIEWQQGS